MLGFNKKTQDASPQENTGGENKVFHFIKTHKKRCIAVVAAAAVLVAVIVPRKSRSASADLAYTQEKLGRRDIVNVYDAAAPSTPPIPTPSSPSSPARCSPPILSWATASRRAMSSMSSTARMWRATSRAHSFRCLRPSAATMMQPTPGTSARRSAAKSAPLLWPQAMQCRPGEDRRHRPRYLGDAAGCGFPRRRGPELRCRSGRAGHAGHHL